MTMLSQHSLQPTHLSQLLLLVLLLGLGRHVADLLDARLHSLLAAAVAHNGGGLLADNHLGGQAQDLIAYLDTGENGLKNAPLLTVWRGLQIETAWGCSCA